MTSSRSRVRESMSKSKVAFVRTRTNPEFYDYEIVLYPCLCCAVMGGTLSAVRDSSIALAAYEPPNPAQYPEKSCVKVPYAFGKQYLAIRVFDVVDATPDYLVETAHPSQTVVLFCHGNGDDLGTVKPYAQWLSAKLGHRVVSFDYPGYGHSSGTTTESSIYQSALLAYHYCVEHLRAQRILLYGKSLGTGAAMFLASRKDIAETKRIAGTILVSPLASGVRTLSASSYMTRGTIEALDNQFMPNVEYAKKVSAPVLVMHGLDDKIIPVSNGYDVHAALPEAYRAEPAWFPHCGHNDIEQKEMGRFRGEIQTFSERVFTDDAAELFESN